MSTIIEDPLIHKYTLIFTMPTIKITFILFWQIHPFLQVVHAQTITQLTHLKLVPIILTFLIYLVPYQPHPALARPQPPIMALMVKNPKQMVELEMESVVEVVETMRGHAQQPRPIPHLLVAPMGIANLRPQKWLTETFLLINELTMCRMNLW